MSGSVSDSGRNSPGRLGIHEAIESGPGRYQLDPYQFHHQHQVMALIQTKLELYDLKLDLYAMDQIYHVQVDAPMESLHPDH
jgi:hypothetical protein